MGGTIKSPLSQETRDLFKTESTAKFFESLAPSTGKAKLDMRFDGEAQTETKALPNGDIEVVFIYPLDDNADAQDGRLYLRDKFVWDPAEKQVKNFSRDFSYNGEGNREHWKPLLTEVSKAAPPSQAAVQEFALVAGRSWSRPFTKRLSDILKPKTDFFNPVLPLLEEEGLEIRISPKTTHFTVIQRQGFNATTDVIFSYEVDDKDDNTTGKIRMRDVFTLSPAGELLGYNRKWDVDVGSRPKDVWKERKERLAGKPKPSFEAAKAFLNGFIPAVYEERPKPSAEKEPVPPPAPPEGGYAQMDFALVMDKMADRKQALTGAKLEGGLTQTLNQGAMYFMSLYQVVQPELDINLADPRMKFSVSGDKDNSIVTLEMTLSEGKWAEETDGILKYKEKFVLEKGKLTAINRSYKVEGPDPKGRLAGVVAKLQAAEAAGKLPPGLDPGSQAFVDSLLPYISSEIFYAAKPRLLDQKDIDFERKQVLGALEAIHKNLKDPLSIPSFDSKKASQVFRILSALEHGDLMTFSQTLQQVQADAQQTLAPHKDALLGQMQGKPLNEEQKKALQDPAVVQAQDVLHLTDILGKIANNQYEEARSYVDQLQSPILKRAVQGPVDRLWKKKHTIESLDMLSHLALDELHERYLASSKILHRGPKLNEEAEAKVISSMFGKVASYLARGHGGEHGADSLTVLKEVRNLSEGEFALNEEEKKACDRVLGMDFAKKLGDIEKEPSVEIQAKYYFEFARSDLFEKGYIGTARYIAQKVAIDKMPKSRSLEGIAVLGEGAANILKYQNEKRVAEAGNKALTDAMALAQKDIKEFEKVHDAQIKAVLENEEIKKLQASSTAFESLAQKWVQQAAAKPDQPILSLLKELTDLSAEEKALREVLLTEPTFAAISKAGGIKKREDRIAAFKLALLGSKPDQQAEGLWGQLQPMLDDPNVKDKPALEAITLILPIAMMPIQDQIGKVINNQILTKIHDDAVEGARKGGGVSADHLPALLAKAKVAASNRPNETMFGVLKALKDDELTPEEKTLRDQLLADKTLQRLDAIGQTAKAEDRKKQYEEFSKEVAKKAQFLEFAIALAQEPNAENRAAILKYLQEENAKDQPPTAPQMKLLAKFAKNFDKTYLPKIEAIAKETDEAKRHQLAQDLQKDPAFAEAGMIELAQWMEQMMASYKLPDRTQESPDPMIQASHAKFASEVKNFLDITEGKGSFGVKVGYGLPHFTKELTSPTMVIAMTGAGLLGPLAEMRMLNVVKNYGAAGRVFAAGVGIGAESFAFTGLHRGLTTTFHHENDPNSSFMKEWGSTALLFTGMRVGHFAAGSFAERVLASGKPGFKWAGGRVVGQPGSSFLTSPAGKMRPTAFGSSPGVPQLTVKGKFVAGTLNHASAIGAMMGSGYVSRALGWQPANGQGWQGNLADAILGYTQAMVGFSVANRLSGGKLQMGIAEMKYLSHMAKLDPAKVEGFEASAVANAKAAGLPELLKGELKDLQATDLVGGKDSPSLTLKPGDTVHLGEVLFGGVDLKVKKEADGSLRLLDVELLGEGETAGVSPADPIVDPVASWQGKLKLNGKELKYSPGRYILLTEGAVLSMEGKSFGLSLPLQSRLFQFMSEKMDPEYQMSLLRRLEKAKDLQEVLKELKDDYREGASLAYEVITALLEGKILLANLPIEMNFQSQIRRLMQVEVDRVAKDHRLQDFDLADDYFNPNWSKVEAEFHKARKVASLKEGITMSQEIGHLLYFLRESKMKTVEGIPVEKMEKWLESQLIKTRMNDVESELKKTQEELNGLKDKKDLDAEEMAQAKEELEIKLKQLNKTKEVVEQWMKLPAIKARQVEAEQELKQTREDFAAHESKKDSSDEGKDQSARLRNKIRELEDTAKALDRLYKDVEAEQKNLEGIGYALGLRQKALDLLAQETQPIASRLTEKEGKVLLNLVQRYLEYNLPNDLPTAESILRIHLDSASLRAKSLLLNATPAAKALLLKVYFGDTPVRQVSDATAAQLVAWMAQGEMESVFKVTYRQVGDRWVSHLAEAEAAYEGSKDGLNLIHGRGKKSEPADLLFKPEEVEEVFGEAKDFVTKGYGEKIGPNALYDAKSRTYRNWVVHPEGGSHLKVEFDADGQPTKVVVLYAAKDGSTILISTFQKGKEALEKLGDKLGVPIELQAMDLKKFNETLPGQVGSLGRLEGFFKGLHKKPLMQWRENRKLNRKFEPTVKDMGPMRRAKDTPEWLKEFLKKNFDGETYLGDKAKEDVSAGKQVDQALEFFGISREEILKDPEVVKKRYRDFAKKYHPDQAGTSGEKFNQLSEKFKEGKNYNEVLQELVESAKKRAQEKGKDDSAKAAKDVPEASDLPKSGLEIFVGKMEEGPLPLRVLGKIIKGISGFFERQWWGQDGKPEAVKRKEAKARKAKAEADAKAGKKPKKPIPPKPAESGPKVDGPRQPLPAGTVLPKPEIKMGEKVGDISPSLSEKPTELTGELAAKTDEGVGYPPPDGKTQSENQDGFSRAYNEHGDLAIMVSDGMGGHAEGKKATEVILGKATGRLAEGAGLKEALEAANQEGLDQVKGGGAVVVTAQVVQPPKKGDPHSVNWAWSGDATGKHYRKSKDGTYYLIYQTIPDSGARQIQEGLKETPGADPADSEAMMRQFGHKVTNHLGKSDAKVRLTAEGEVPDPKNPKEMKKANGLDSVGLEKNDWLLLMTDGAENVPEAMIIRWLNEGHSAEKVVDLINAEAHRRMAIVQTATKAGANETNRYEFEYEGQKLYIEVHGHHGYVFDAPTGGKQVDTYRADNVTVAAYKHNPVKKGKSGPPALPPKTTPQLPPGSGDGTPEPAADGSGQAGAKADGSPATPVKDSATPPPSAKEPADVKPNGDSQTTAAKPLQVRFKKANDVDGFLAEYGQHVTQEGIRFPGKNPPAEGTVLPFEFLLGDGTPLLSGKGKIVKNASGETYLHFEELSPGTQKNWEAIQAKKNPPAQPAVDSANPPPPEQEPADVKAKTETVSPSNKTQFRFKKAGSVDEFASEYGAHVTPEGIRFPGKNSHPEGTILQFEFLLNDGSSVLSGRGKIVKDASGKDFIHFEQLGAPSQKNWEAIQAKKNSAAQPVAAVEKVDEPAPGNKDKEPPVAPKVVPDSKTEAEPYQTISGMDEFVRNHGSKVTTDRKDPTPLTIRLDSPDLEAYVEKNGGEINSQGMFLPMKDPLSVGASVYFKLQVGEGTPLIAGLGTVVSTRPVDPAQPNLPAGIRVRFEYLSPEGSQLLKEVMAKRKSSGGGSASGGSNGGGSLGRPPEKNPDAVSPGLNVAPAPKPKAVPPPLPPAVAKPKAATPPPPPPGGKTKAVPPPPPLRNGNAPVDGTKPVLAKGTTRQPVTLPPPNPPPRRRATAPADAKNVEAKPVGGDSPIPAKAKKITLPVKVTTTAQLVRGFSGKVGGNGIFIPVKKQIPASEFPTGSEVDFTFVSPEKKALLQGKGTVLNYVTVEEAQRKGINAGLYLRFSDISAGNRAVLAEMAKVQAKKAAKDAEAFDDSPTVKREIPAEVLKKASSPGEGDQLQ